MHALETWFAVLLLSRSRELHPAACESVYKNKGKFFALALRTVEKWLVPTPFLYGRGERREGRKGLVNNFPAAFLPSVLMRENANVK